MTAIQPSPIQELSAKNDVEFNNVFRDNHLRLFHYSLQLVGDREDALDITQETFLRLHRH